MFIHHHQTGVGTGKRLIATTQLQAVGRHEPIDFVETIDAGDETIIPLPRLASIFSIVVEARPHSDASQVTPNVFVEIGGREIVLRKGPFQWFDGCHWDSPFGADVTELRVSNHEDEPIIFRGSILPAALLDDESASPAVVTTEPTPDLAEV